MWLVLFWLAAAIAVRIVLRKVPTIPFNWRIVLWICFVLFLLFAFMAIGPIGFGKFEIISTFPNTCPTNEELDGAVCYPKCRDGYHGVGPVCWANSKNVGVGKVANLSPCGSGTIDIGLLCQPTKCSVSDFFKGRCFPRPKRLVCAPNRSDGNTEMVAGLCYKPCNKRDKDGKLPEPNDGLNSRIAGMPYLCYAGGSLSYGRGAGSVPSLFRLFGRYPIL
jgi:hypothetical protein